MPKTNIDFTNVRTKGIKYNYQDLESSLFVNDLNEIIVNTYKDQVKNKKTVVFCASVKHEEVIAKLFRDNDYNAQAVSGATKSNKRKQILEEYEDGTVPKQKFYLWQDQLCQKQYIRQLSATKTPSIMI